MLTLRDESQTAGNWWQYRAADIALDGETEMLQVRRAVRLVVPQRPRHFGRNFGIPLADFRRRQQWVDSGLSANEVTRVFLPGQNLCARVVA